MRLAASEGLPGRLATHRPASLKNCIAAAHDTRIQRSNFHDRKQCNLAAALSQTHFASDRHSAFKIDWPNASRAAQAKQQSASASLPEGHRLLQTAYVACDS